MSDSLVKIPDQWLPLKGDFFSKNALQLARDLLGCLLLIQKGDVWIGGAICETEAYTDDDPASHSFKGPSKRNQSMFEQGGTIYVYLIYGVHLCLNFASGEKGKGEAVLIRAVDPLFGVELMVPGAGRSVKKICSGPGRLCAALGIDRRLDGVMVGEGFLRVYADPSRADVPVVVEGPRIGISKAVDKHWRFGIKGHPSLSRTF